MDTWRKGIQARHQQVPSPEAGLWAAWLQRCPVSVADGPRPLKGTRPSSWEILPLMALKGRSTDPLVLSRLNKC